MNVSVPAGSLWTDAADSLLSFQDSWVGKLVENTTVASSGPHQLSILSVSISGDIRCLHYYTSTGTDCLDSFLSYFCSRWRQSWNRPSVKPLPQHLGKCSSFLTRRRKKWRWRWLWTTLPRLYHVAFVSLNSIIGWKWTMIQRTTLETKWLKSVLINPLNLSQHYKDIQIIKTATLTLYV